MRGCEYVEMVGVTPGPSTRVVSSDTAEGAASMWSPARSCQATGG